MNLKFVFVVIVVSYSFLLKECYSRPFWNYIFSEDDTPKLDDALIDEIGSTSPTTNIVANEKPKIIDDGKKKVDEKSVKLASSSAADRTRPASSTNGSKIRTAETPIPALNDRMTQMTLMGGISRLLGRTVDGTKQLVDSGTDTVSGTIKNVAKTYSNAVDNVTDAIDRSGKRVDDRINSWIKMLDASRKMLSGSIKKDADQAHSFTIKMSSATPMNSLTGLLSGGSAWPEVTGFETNLFG